jgi:hypothetical protein
MKKIYSLLLAISVSLFVAASPIITVVNNNGHWNSNSTWNLNRKPQDGDTVIIPAGFKVDVTNNVNFGNKFLYIKTYGTLHLNSGKITLNDESTVYIYVNGKLTSTGKNSEKIKIGNSEKYSGTDGTINGPAMADGSTGDEFANLTPLPVKFVSFNAARKNNDVIIDWATAQEINSDRFEIQRSEDGNFWLTIGSVKAAGNSDNVLSYSYTDRNLSGKTQYYRIKQIDLDDTFIYTAVKMVQFTGSKAEVKVAVASRDMIAVHFSEQIKGKVTVRLINFSGQVISQQSLSSPVGQVMISSHVQAGGSYIVSIVDANGLVTSKQVIL